MATGKSLKEQKRSQGFVTAAEAATLAGVSTKTVIRWGEKTLVTTHRVNKTWFFLRSSVAAFVQAEDK